MDLRNKVLDQGYKIAVLMAKDNPGEDYNSGYKKFKEVFLKIIKSDRKLEKELKLYFKELSYRMQYSINWNAYSREVLQAAVTDLIQADWVGEQLTLRVILTEALKDAILAGGMMTELETKIPIGFSEKSPRAIEFIRKHGADLAKGLTDTTKDKVRQSLLTSISVGESQSDAATRMAEIIDDKYRAEMIAHTEAINAFSAGRLEVAGEVGADRKEWSASPDAVDICAEMDGEVVGLEDSFSSGDDSPPAHPNCRCLVRILLPNE